MSYDAPNYTQVPNLLFDEHMLNMKEAELKVTLAIARKTFGWQKKEDQISLSQLVELTGLSNQGVRNGIDAGVERGTIIRRPHGQSFIYSLQIKPALRTKTVQPSCIVEPTELCNEVAMQRSSYATELHSAMPPDSTELCNEVATQKKYLNKEIKKDSSDHRLSSSLPADQPQQPKRTRQTDPDYNRICTAFESDGFGILTPILAGQVGTMLDSYPVKWIVDAMAIAVARNSRNLSYVNGILRNFSTEGRGQRATGNPFADERNEPPAVTPPPVPRAASAPAADNGPLAEVWRNVVAVASPAAREWLAQTQLRSVADGCAVIAAPAKSAQYISSQLGNQIRRSMATAGHPVRVIEVMAASAAESEQTA
jgi:phage replication O-like protein O